MKLQQNNKSGFTLIEIIIVIIIVGVLASLALPKFTKQINISKGAEALNMLGAINRSLDRCIALNASGEACDTFTKLGMADPGTNGKFNYAFTWNDTANTLTVKADLKTTEGGAAAKADYVQSVMDIDDGSATLSSGGIFTSVVKSGDLDVVE